MHPTPPGAATPSLSPSTEERALNLLGQKMKAAQLFYGDEVASALCDDEEGNFLSNNLILSVLAVEKQPSDDRRERPAEDKLSDVPKRDSCIIGISVNKKIAFRLG